MDDDAYIQIGDATRRLGVTPSGPPGALYPPEISDDVVEEVTAFLPVMGLSAGDVVIDGPVTAGAIPAATVAVAVHTGPYDTLGDAYRLLGVWVAQNAAHAERPVREIYLVSYTGIDDPAQFRTEIHWPVLDQSLD